LPALFFFFPAFRLRPSLHEPRDASLCFRQVKFKGFEAVLLLKCRTYFTWRSQILAAASSPEFQ
jgi:hypothetical protein